MTVVLCASIAWAAYGFLFMGLGLVVLLFAERASGSPRAMIADARIADHSGMTNSDLEISRPQLAQETNQLAQDAEEFVNSVIELARLRQHSIPPVRRIRSRSKFTKSTWPLDSPIPSRHARKELALLVFANETIS